MIARYVGVMRAAVAVHLARWSEHRGGLLIHDVGPRVMARRAHQLGVAASRDLCRRGEDDVDARKIAHARDPLPTGPRSI